MNKNKVLFAVLVVCLVFFASIGCKKSADAIPPNSTNKVDVQQFAVSLKNCNVGTPNTETNISETFWEWEFVINNFPQNAFGYFFVIYWGDETESPRVYINSAIQNYSEPHQFPLGNGESYNVSIRCVAINTNDGTEDLDEPVEVWLGEVNSAGVVVN